MNGASTRRPRGGAVGRRRRRRATPQTGSRSLAARAARRPRARARRGVSRCAPAPIRIWPGLGRLLEPRGDVDGLAGREGRSASSATTSPASMPIRASSPSSSTASRIASAGADRALGVVLVGQRDAEGGHDGVAGELLDDAAVRARCSARRASKKRVTRRRTTSGSAPATSSVEPTRSTNITVASFRSITSSVGTRGRRFRGRAPASDVAPVASRRARPEGLQGVRRARDLSRPSSTRTARTRSGARTSSSSSRARIAVGRDMRCPRRRWPRR